MPRSSDDHPEAFDPSTLPPWGPTIEGTLESISPDWLRIRGDDGVVLEIRVQHSLPLANGHSRMADGPITLEYIEQEIDGKTVYTASQRHAIEALGDRFKPAEWWINAKKAEQHHRRARKTKTSE